MSQNYILQITFKFISIIWLSNFVKTLSFNTIFIKISEAHVNESLSGLNDTALEMPNLQYTFKL